MKSILNLLLIIILICCLLYFFTLLPVFAKNTFDEVLHKAGEQTKKEAIINNSWFNKIRELLIKDAYSDIELNSAIIEVNKQIKSEYTNKSNQFLFTKDKGINQKIYDLLVLLQIFIKSKCNNPQCSDKIKNHNTLYLLREDISKWKVGGHALCAKIYEELKFKKNPPKIAKENINNKIEFNTLYTNNGISVLYPKGKQYSILRVNLSYDSDGVTRLTALIHNNTSQNWLGAKIRVMIYDENNNFLGDSMYENSGYGCGTDIAHIGSGLSGVCIAEPMLTINDLNRVKRIEFKDIYCEIDPIPYYNSDFPQLNH